MNKIGRIFAKTYHTRSPILPLEAIVSPSCWPYIYVAVNNVVVEGQKTWTRIVQTIASWEHVSGRKEGGVVVHNSFSINNKARIWYMCILFVDLEILEYLNDEKR